MSICSTKIASHLVRMISLRRLMTQFLHTEILTELFFQHGRGLEKGQPDACGGVTETASSGMNTRDISSWSVYVDRVHNADCLRWGKRPSRRGNRQDALRSLTDVATCRHVGPRSSSTFRTSELSVKAVIYTNYLITTPSSSSMCTLVEMYEHLWGTFCLRFQDRKNNAILILTAVKISNLRIIR